MTDREADSVSSIVLGKYLVQWGGAGLIGFFTPWHGGMGVIIAVCLALIWHGIIEAAYGIWRSL